jgi:hypothetical protein
MSARTTADLGESTLTFVIAEREFTFKRFTFEMYANIEEHILSKRYSIKEKARFLVATLKEFETACTEVLDPASEEVKEYVKECVLSAVKEGLSHAFDRPQHATLVEEYEFENSSEGLAAYFAESTGLSFPEAYVFVKGISSEEDYNQLKRALIKAREVAQLKN